MTTTATPENWVNDTLEVESDDIDVTSRPSEDPHAGIAISSVGAHAGRVALHIDPDTASRHVDVSKYTIVDHADETIEVIGYFTISNRDDALRITAAIMAAFPNEGI